MQMSTEPSDETAATRIVVRSSSIVINSESCFQGWLVHSQSDGDDLTFSTEVFHALHEYFVILHLRNRAFKYVDRPRR